MEGAATRPFSWRARRKQRVDLGARRRTQTPTGPSTFDRCRGIREINERLQPWLAQTRAALERRHAAALADARKERILASREYAFCLYPEDTIREFFDSLLAEGD